MMDLDPRHYDHIAIKDDDINNIVLSYLVHNCYKETMESFTASTGMKHPNDYLEDMEKRKRILQLTIEGNVLQAIELIKQMAHGFFEKNEDLHFDLLSLHFVELVSSKKCTEALEFAQTELTTFGKVQKYMEKLEDFMALLAYEDPEKSPMFHLLSFEYRQDVADSLNRAILGLFHIDLSCFFVNVCSQDAIRDLELPAYTAMERLMKQATVVRQCLSQESSKDGIPPFSLKNFLKN